MLSIRVVEECTDLKRAKRLSLLFIINQPRVKNCCQSSLDYWNVTARVSKASGYFSMGNFSLLGFFQFEF